MADTKTDLNERTMTLVKHIAAPREAVWNAWVDEQSLPRWWGPDGFSCQTKRIDLRTGGEWVFDMIAPDGTVFPNHHRYTLIQPKERIEYTLLWGESGPEHAHATATFEDSDRGTRVTMAMIFSSIAEYEEAKGFDAERLGYQTLGKLEKAVLGT